MPTGGYEVIVTQTQSEWTDLWDPASRRIVLDGTMISELHSIGDDVFATLIAMFVDTSRTNLSGIASALDRSDFAAIAHQAHELAGGASYIAASSLAAHAHAIESAANQSRADEIHLLLEMLPSHIERSLAALRHVEKP